MTRPEPKAQMSSLFTDFAQYFDLTLATTPAQRAAVFEIRYHVYCEEFGYESVEVFQNKQEKDEFDDQSLHCLVTHRATGVPAGCVRLVLVDEEERLPMELHSGEAIDTEFMERFRRQRTEMCEISRLAVDGAFRRRRGEKKSQFGEIESLSFDEREKRTFPLIAVALFLASAASADLIGRRHVFAIMEPFLQKILRRTGVGFERVGEDFEFRGTRAPYYADVADLVRNCPAELRICYDLVKQQFAGVLTPSAGDSIVSRTVKAPVVPFPDSKKG